MAEYKLSYTAKEIDEKLGKVDDIKQFSEEIAEDITNIADDINNERNERLANEKVLTERMNTFTTLPEASTSGDAELADARIDFNGYTYVNVGEHIRSVTGRLSEEKADKDYVVSVFEQLKQLILNGNIESAVAVLDEAILDLSTLA